MPAKPRKLIDPEVFINALREESDRGCILIGLEAIHLNLEELLCAKLSHHPKAATLIEQQLSPDSPNALLGSFWAKQTIAFMMGLIDHETYEALEALRKIRNRAAHFTGPLVLDTADGRLANFVAKSPSVGKQIVEWADKVHNQMTNFEGDAKRGAQMFLEDAGEIVGVKTKAKLRFVIALFALGTHLYSLARQSSGS